MTRLNKFGLMIAMLTIITLLTFYMGEITGEKRWITLGTIISIISGFLITFPDEKEH